MYDLDKVFRTIIKQGLRDDKANKRGISFLVRKKEHFTLDGVKGFVCGSQQAIQLNANGSTHWTPNLYCYGEYTDSSRKYIKGFEESNLRQINTFVIDIDSKNYSPGEIILHAIDTELGEPTLIVESNKGYHVYYVLDHPIYITNNSNFKSLKVAKRISNNLKNCFEKLGADIGCNDFVFFRIPNQKNIVWFNEYKIYSLPYFINWSQQFDDSLGKTFKLLIGGKSSISNSEWISDLLENEQIRGCKGQYGRNNIIFTLALSCMEDGKNENECFDIIDQFNSNLIYPIPIKEINNIIRSAYSGKYSGKSDRYVKEFYELYTNKEYKIELNRKQWYKFKRPRDERKNSHYREWEHDIVKYLNLNIGDRQFIQLSQNQLCEQIGISRSSLNELIKQSKVIIKRSLGKGRQAITQWSTVTILYRYAIKILKEIHDNYSKYLQQYITDVIESSEPNEAIIILSNYLMDMLTKTSNQLLSG